MLRSRVCQIGLTYVNLSCRESSWRFLSPLFSSLHLPAPIDEKVSEVIIHDCAALESLNFISVHCLSPVCRCVAQTWLPSFEWVSFSSLIVPHQLRLRMRHGCIDCLQSIIERKTVNMHKHHSTICNTTLCTADDQQYVVIRHTIIRNKAKCRMHGSRLLVPSFIKH